VEADGELVELSGDRAREVGVGMLRSFEHADLFEADFSAATVAALYILPEMSEELVPKLGKLQPGSRVVSHASPVPGLKPDKVIRHQARG
jgi:hypothetical protein